MLRRFLHNQQEATAPSGMGFVPAVEVLLKKLWIMDIKKGRGQAWWSQAACGGEKIVRREGYGGRCKKNSQIGINKNRWQRSKSEQLEMGKGDLEGNYLFIPFFITIVQIKKNINDLDFGQHLNFTLNIIHE